MRTKYRQQQANTSQTQGEQLRVGHVMRLGFVAVLGLTFCIGMLGLFQLHSLKTNMTNIVEVGNEKTALAIKMRDAIRLRALSVQRMLATSDYFSRDEELQNYYAYSGMYRSAREALFAMDMNREERDLHQILQMLTRVAQPVNREAAEMLMMDPLPRDFDSILEKAVFAQQQLLGLLDQFVDLQKYYAREKVQHAEEKFQTTIIIMTAVVVLLLIVGTFIAKRVTHLVTSKNSELAEKNKELEAAWFEAANATHAKSKFLANMSHEIRTPLTSIIGFAETLEDVGQDPEDLVRAAEVIKRSGNHLHEIINDVLDISKIEAGQIELEVRDASPGAIVSEVSSIMEERVRKKGLEFEANSFYPIPRLIRTDPTRLRQILLNLVGNAIKFTEHGKITINTCYLSNEHKMKFEVIDTGIGMSEEVLAKVFEPFSQADKTTARKYGGTGLGLSISKQLAEKMGGDIVCESTLGNGTIFTATVSIGDISVPELIFEDQEVHVELTGKAFRPSRNKQYTGKILLAEDTEETQKLIALHLRRSGIDVEVVSDGKQAVDVALSKEFDLVLMDMQMPVMSGLEATNRLRQAGYNKPIIALTANTSQADRDACINAGSDGFLTKPINFEKFYSMLEEHLPASKHRLPTVTVPSPHVDESLVDDQEFQAILSSFLVKLPDMVDTISQSAREQDWETLRSISHQLKGLGSSFGYQHLTEVASQLQDSARNQEAGHLLELVDELKLEYKQIHINTLNDRKVV